MKLVDYTRQPKTPGFLQQIIENLPVWLPFLFSEKTPMTGSSPACHAAWTTAFSFLKNIPLGNSPDLSPYLLIGPPGLVILNVSTQKGIYRARDESWWEMSRSSRQYQPARRNLIRQSLELEQRLGAFLERQSFKCPAIQSVLLFIDPGVHVETLPPGGAYCACRRHQKPGSQPGPGRRCHARRPDSRPRRSAGSLSPPRAGAELAG